MDDARIDALIASNEALAESNSLLADAIRLQTLGLHALADAIAAPIDGQDPDQPGDQPADDVPRYMDGKPIDD
jgi:hypothetical protein